MNDLERVLQGTEEEISYYLEAVPTLEFKKDVEDLLKKNSDKYAIKLAIESLQKLL